MASPSFLFSGTGTSHFHQPVIKHPSLVSGLHATPQIYRVHVQAVHLPGGTSLQSFISDDIVFQNPTLQSFLWLGPTPTLRGRVLLSNGLLPACSRKHSCYHAVAEVQRLWQITTHSQHQISLHSGIFVPIPANVAAFQGPLGPLSVGRPYSLYQMLSEPEEPILPLWEMDPLDHAACFWGIHPTSPEHHQALSSEPSDSVLHCL